MFVLRCTLLFCFALTASAQEAPPKSEPVSGDAVHALQPEALQGSWRYDVTLPDDGQGFGTFVFKTSRGQIRGRAQGFADVPFDTIVIDGKRLRLVFRPQGTAEVTVEATVEGDAMRGTLSGTDPATDQPVTLPFTANRTD